MIFLAKKAFRTGAFVACLGTPLMINAQVLVHQEPIHRPVFQNQQIRILNVLLPAGDTTQYHIHHTPSGFIFFTSTSIASQSKKSSASVGRTEAGNIIVENLAAPNLRTHRVWNVDSVPLHVMDVELLSGDNGFTKMPLTIPGLILLVDTTWARVYKTGLKAGSELVFNKEPRLLLLVALTKASAKIKDK